MRESYPTLLNLIEILLLTRPAITDKLGALIQLHCISTKAKTPVTHFAYKRVHNKRSLEL